MILKKFSVFIFIITFGVSLGIIVPRFLEMVVIWGNRIPQEELESDYFFACLWAIVLGASILAWPVSSGDKRCLCLAWLGKSVVTLLFMLLYESYYWLDAYTYFDLSRQNNLIWENIKIGFGTDFIIVALAWLHNQIFPNFYHVLKVSFSMIGLIAVYLFYRTGVVILQRERRSAFYTIAFFPSILFWSSILGKEPVVLLGMALYVYGVAGWNRYALARYLWLLSLGVAVASIIRLWLGPILLMPLLVFIFRRTKKVISKVAFIILVIGMLLFSTKYFFDQFSIRSPHDIPIAAYTVARNFANTPGGSSQELKTELVSANAFAAFIPLAAFTALFRPLPGEILNPFGLLAGLENLSLLIIMGLAIKRTRLRELYDPMVIWAILLILLWAAIYGFASYGNLGAAVRFKLQILPVMLGLLLYLARRRPKGV